MADWSGWIGRRETADDIVAPARTDALAATLDLPPPWPGAGDELPPAWHWIFCTPCVPTADLDGDGHERRGRFLPPVDLPRRMWAGGRLVFDAAPVVGAPLTRVSTIRDVTEKHGTSGRLVFVAVAHEWRAGDAVCIREDQDIVYRQAPPREMTATAKPASKPAPADADITETVNPDPSLLFRYSALTFNAHKIHLDRTYAMSVEGYPGLVVHGPLIATLLLDLPRRHFPGRRLAAFSFRAVGPLFDTAPFSVHAKVIGDERLDLWAANDEGALATQASATFA